MTQIHSKSQADSIYRSAMILITLLSALTGSFAYLSLRHPGWCVAYSQARGYHINYEQSVCNPQQ